MKEFVQHLDSTVPAQLSALNLPGCALALIENSEVTALRCYGYANVKAQTPLTENSIFQVASISKSLTAWGIMKLVEAGKLDLDAPVDTYLTRWHLPPSEYDSTAVTPRLLLMHFGGTSLSGCGGTTYDDTWYTAEDILYGRTPSLDEGQRAYCLKWGLDPDSYGQPVHLLQAPDTAFAYSGGGFTILELIIEEITGKSFTEFMSDAIFNPLGMPESSFELRESQLPLVATPYNEELQEMALLRINGKAAGGMYSTITELARFACAEMDGANGEPAGRGVLCPASIAEMQRPDRYAETQMDMDFHTGLGHYVLDLGDIRAVQHTGGNPGWRSVYTVIPEKKLGFVCLINSAGGNDLWMDLMQQWSATFMP